MAEQRPPLGHHAPVWGVFLLFLGGVFLLQNLDVLPWGLWGILWRFWPVLIIITGVSITLRRYNVWLVSSLVLVLLFDWFGLVVGLRRFRKQAPERRRRQVGWWRNSRLGVMRDFVQFQEKMITFLHFSQLGPFAWVFLYGFVVCAALRLARFNLQAGEGKKTLFTGLPSPAAGMTLATYYPFTQTAFFQTQLSDWAWNSILIFLVIALSVGMVSNVQYPRMPRIGFRTFRGLAGLGFNLTVLGLYQFGCGTQTCLYLSDSYRFYRYEIRRGIYEKTFYNFTVGSDSMLYGRLPGQGCNGRA